MTMFSVLHEVCATCTPHLLSWNIKHSASNGQVEDNDEQIHKKWLDTYL